MDPSVELGFYLSVVHKVLGKTEQHFENAEGKFTCYFSYHIELKAPEPHWSQPEAIVTLYGYRVGYPIKVAPFRGKGTQDCTLQATEAFRALRNGLGVPLEGESNGAYANAEGRIIDPEPTL